MSGVSRRRLLQGAAGGGAVVAAGAVGVPKLARGEGEPGLVPWRGPRQAGITTPRTDHAIVAAFDVVDDELAGLLRDLTARFAELTQGRPDTLDPIDNPALPPSDTGELGYEAAARRQAHDYGRPGGCRDLRRQFQAVKERTVGQDLDEYMVAVGGGYFFCPPGVSGRGDYLAEALVRGIPSG